MQTSGNRQSFAWLVIGLSAGLTAIPCTFFCDTLIAQSVAKFQLPGDINKAVQLAEVFAHGSGVIAIFATLWWIDRDRRRLIQFAMGMTLLSSVIANVLKYPFSRYRPNSGTAISGVDSWLAIFDGSFWDSTHRSFPSGHSATAVALAIGLSIVYPRGKYFFATFALMACLQRIVSQAHYPSDVLAGAAIATLCCWICMRFSKGVR